MTERLEEIKARSEAVSVELAQANWKPESITRNRDMIRELKTLFDEREKLIEAYIANRSAVRSEQIRDKLKQVTSELATISWNPGTITRGGILVGEINRLIEAWMELPPNDTPTDSTVA